MNSHIEELQTLLMDWEAGTLDDKGVERVREILQIDEEARSYFVQLQMIDAAIQLDADAGVGATPISSEGTPPASARLPVSQNAGIGVPSYAIALTLVCLLAGWLIFLQFNENSTNEEIGGVNNPVTRDKSKEATASGVAMVTRLVDVVWDSEQTPLDVGDALAPGRFAIRSGFAQVEFFCGATVVIEGPAELDVQTAMLVHVTRGRLRAQVPPAARGFALKVDDMKVVDLGTEFALSVSPKGTDVQVFDGEVELHQPNEKKQLLKAGQAVVRTAAGEIEDAEVSPESFVDIQTLESRSNGQRDARVQRWNDWSTDLRRDTRLIAYYTFDQKGGWNRKLTNEAESPQDDLDGAIVGARRVQGRWPSKSGLEFKRPGDRVRVDIPGEYNSLTFACWIKIDSLDRWFNSLFLTDNYNKGEPHWQILDTGQIYFSVRPSARGTKGPRDQKILSPPFWKPSMSGKWLHLATTYDVDAQRATHYLNGKMLHTEAIPEKHLVKTTRIGAATIGNWSQPTLPDAKFAIRNLNGSIDELSIFAAALTADEIKEMYENGKP